MSTKQDLAEHCFCQQGTYTARHSHDSAVQHAERTALTHASWQALWARGTKGALRNRAVREGPSLHRSQHYCLVTHVCVCARMCVVIIAGQVLLPHPTKKTHKLCVVPLGSSRVEPCHPTRWSTVSLGATNTSALCSPPSSDFFNSG